MEPQVVDAASELATGLGGIVHRETGKGAELLAVVFDLVGGPVVDLSDPALGLGPVDDALDTRDGQGDDGVTDAVVIREPDTLIFDVADLAHVTFAVARVDVEG